MEYNEDEKQQAEDFFAEELDINHQDDGSIVDILPPPKLTDFQFQQLEELQHLSLYSEMLVLLSAERGMGKTLLAQALLATREVPDHSLMLEADFALRYIDILSEIAAVYGIAEPAQDFEMLENQVVAQSLELLNSQKGSMLLVIDNANQLDNETLDDLNNLALLAPNALHIMLLATPDFEDAFAQVSEPKAPSYVVDLDTLDDDEIIDILHQSFPQKAWSDEEVDYVLNHAGGNPGKTLYIAKQFLEGKELLSPPASQSGKFPIAHIAGIAGVAILLLIIYFIQAGEREQKTTLETVQQSVKSSDSESELINKNHNEQEKSDSSTSLQAEAVNVEQQTKLAELDGSEVQAVATIEVTPAAVASIEEKTNGTGQVESIEAPKAQQVVAEEQVENHPTELERNAPNTAKNTAPTVDQEIKDGYVLQLFGSHDRTSASDFAQDNGTSQIALQVYQTTYNGKPWYVVATEPYADSEIAKSQIPKLSSKLRQLKPWARSTSAFK